jgi:hypothetical protein
VKKGIFILSGAKDPKNQFAKIVREKDYWSWNLNDKNVLGKASHEYLGWNGKRDSKYYEFIGKLFTLVNEYWNFDEDYLTGRINQFINNDKVHLAVIHNCREELIPVLREKFNALTVHLADGDTEGIGQYDYILDFNGESFDQDVVNLLNTIIEK